MSRHEGVSCDACMKGSFVGNRFKCLICYDYDLCSNCYYAGVQTAQHSSDHPMQCILTRSDYEVYYGGEAVTSDRCQSFTCPLCGLCGLSESLFLDHVSAEHVESSQEVVCSLCAGIGGGDPNRVTDDLAGHVNLEHRSSVREVEERIRTTVGLRQHRLITSSQVNQTGNSSASRVRRTNNIPLSTTVSSLGGLSASLRETMDPLAELLSHLTVSSNRSVVESMSNQLQQLEKQFLSTRSRQQTDSSPRTRQQLLDSMGRIQPPAFIVPPSISSMLLSQPPVAVTSSTPIVSSSSSNSATAANVRVFTINAKQDSQYLLTRYVEKEQVKADKLGYQEEIDALRVMFIEELLVASMSETLHEEDSDSNLVHSSSSSDVLKRVIDNWQNVDDIDKPKNVDSNVYSQRVDCKHVDSPRNSVNNFNSPKNS